ncbi:MAG: TB2/DP1, HVA22 family-domain-containing protein [Monoraphidium minutum]|nr:MAG: TB2/DP1, HVA22 family-domain-containing protein [Monoraphidium minutum]
MAIQATMSLVYTLLFGAAAYAIPAYSTFKAVEKKGGEDVRDWAQYWVILAAFICSQWAVDFLLCWLPFYYLAKLGFLVALWHPSTKLAAAIYAKALAPLVSSYEADIDRFVSEGRAKAGDLVGQHSAQLRSQARQLAGQGTVMLKNIQQKAMERAKAASSKMGTEGVTHTD